MSGEKDASGLKKVLVWYGTPALKKISKRLGGVKFFFFKVSIDRVKLFIVINYRSLSAAGSSASRQS